MAARTGTRRALVAMSGGVDSALAVVRLQQEGWEVEGATLQLEPTGTCGAEDGLAAARAVAAYLGVPHRAVVAGDLFERAVLRPAWEDYAAGRTPSPCCRCNPSVKFGVLVEVARDLGCGVVATGHYARRVEGSGGVALFRGADRTKDQSYFLFGLLPEHLAVARFPLGDLAKAEVRRMAVELGLPNALRRESQDACVAAGEEGLADWLAGRFGARGRPGRVLDEGGHMLASHAGVHRFTVGQRRGLGVALGRPAWVCAVDGASADVTVTTRPEALLARGLVATAFRWHGAPPADGARVAVQVRYRAPPVAASVLFMGDEAEIRFATPVRAVTPGQAAVVYDGDQLLGGGWIREALR